MTIWSGTISFGHIEHLPHPARWSSSTDDADNPPAPTDVRRALAVLDHAITDYVTNARLGTAV